MNCRTFSTELSSSERGGARAFDGAFFRTRSIEGNVNIRNNSVRHAFIDVQMFIRLMNGNEDALLAGDRRRSLQVDPGHPSHHNREPQKQDRDDDPCPGHIASRQRCRCPIVVAHDYLLSTKFRREMAAIT